MELSSYWPVSVTGTGERGSLSVRTGESAGEIDAARLGCVARSALAGAILAVDDFSSGLLHVAGGVARVHDEFGMVDDGVVIVAGVIGGNQHAVVACEVFRRQFDGSHIRKIVVAHFME